MLRNRSNHPLVSFSSHYTDQPLPDTTEVPGSAPVILDPPQLIRSGPEDRSRFAHETPSLAVRSVYALLTVLLLYTVVRGFYTAATRPMWYDELATAALSSQPDLKTVWTSSLRPFDGSPIGFYVIERAGFGLLKNKDIATRLPAIFAFPCTLLCIFIYFRRRTNPFVALLCALLPLSSVLFTRYAVEGRPYGLLVAFIALALVCYQRMPSTLWTALHAISLFLAQAVHHFAVFSMIPFALAETTVLVRARRVRWNVWLAMGFGVLPLLIALPALQRYRAFYGGHFYAPYGFHNIPAMFGNFFFLDSPYGAGLLVLCIAGVMAALFWPLPNRHNGALAEGTLLLSFLLLPGIVLALMTVMHGGMRDAYILPTILGVYLSLGYLFLCAPPRGVVLVAAFLVLSLGVQEFRFWSSARTSQAHRPSAGLQTLLSNSGYQNSSTPIVVAGGMVYAPLAYYSPEPLKKRLFYLMDEQKAQFYGDEQMMEQNINFFQDYMPMQLRDYDHFVAEHPAFLLYAQEPESYVRVWLLRHIQREGYFVQEVRATGPDRLF